MAQLLSGGQYLRWRDRLVEEAVRHGVREGSLVLDVATGTGLVAHGLTKSTGARVIGADLTAGMLQNARAQARRRDDPLAARLVNADATRLPFGTSCFDAVTTSYLLRYVEDPDEAIKSLVEPLRPGGFFGLIEFHVPPGPAWRLLWKAHTRLVLPAVGAMAGRGWWHVGRFLGPSIETYWKHHTQAQLQRAMQQAGLRETRVHTMSLGGGVVAWGTKDPQRTRTP